jgi:P2-related tail formation protein
MTDVIKVLGQLDAAATTTEVLYTVPDVTVTTVSSFVACNRNAAAQTFRLSIHVNDAGADNKQFLYYDKQVDANDTLTAVIGITLGQGDVMKVYASSTDFSFSVFGVETS